MALRSGSSASKPGPAPSAEQRWFQERPSSYPWEQDGLDHVKRLMPNAEPYRAWATFSFTAASGRINECDLLIAVPGGLYLVELKGHPGRAINNGDTWSFFQEDAKRVLTLRNPLHLLDMKCKDLKTRLEWAAKQLHLNQRVPWVEPAIFLSARGLQSGLDEVQSSHVYGRDDECGGLPWIWRDLLATPPQREARRITPEFSQHVLPRLMAKIGIAPATAHLRFGDDWMLRSEPLDAGKTWEDRLAEHPGIVREEGRVRIYLTAQQASEEAKQSVERAARREYQVLQGINHRGIAQAVQIREHQGGPAILFRHRASDLRLDSYLDVHGDRLSPETRLDMVRQLAEAVRYAHSRSLYHRALAARSVYVSAKEDGCAPVLRIIDWQSAARDFDTTGMSSLMTSSPAGEHLADPAEVYFAPEFETLYADPVDLDVFGLGAIAYLVVTGRPPAAQRSGLIERLTGERGLHPYAVSDGVSDALDDLIYRATRTDVADRLASTEAFLDALDVVEQDSPAPAPAGSALDPLTATPGQLVDGDWTVERVLGTGATSRVLLLSHPAEDDDEQRRELRVLKIALDQEKAARLDAEATALEKVDGGVVVRLLGGPREVGGRTVLDLQYAGDKSLGAWLRAEGKLSYQDLERFGGDLFTALDQLARTGVQHRDLKPDNFGVCTRADGATGLMLFDFSLADVSERDIKAGTRGYLDPFLGTPQRPAFDGHAERYAAAVTLHEMASGLKPVWGDGLTDPRTARDETPALAADLFEPALRDGLTAFFRRAFHRDVDRRFDSVRQMTDAWRTVFATADATIPPTTPATVGLAGRTLEETRDAHAEAAELGTSLDTAGLSPRAVSVAQSFGATTVGELLGVKLYEIAKARGAGTAIRKELNRRHKQWTARLLHPAGRIGHLKHGGARTTLSEPAIASGKMTVEDMAMLLAPAAGRKDSKKADVIRLTLGLPDEQRVPEQWPTQVKVAKDLRITQASVSRHQQVAAKEWAAQPWLTVVRNELVELVAEAGRVMTAPELAAQLSARHGTLLDESPDRILARALAVVRAAVEVELRAGVLANDMDVDEPRLAVLRRGGRVLVALESLSGTDDPSAPELAEYALGLGQRADELATQDPLPGRAVVIRDLRAVRAPDGLAPLADTRLVSLAAAMSQHAAASPRLELYPRELELVKALRISQAAAGVREPGITVDDLLARVRARFPELTLGGVTYVRLEEALTAAGFPLAYDTDAHRFRPPAPESTGDATGSHISTSAHGRWGAAGLDPLAVLVSKLATSVERGGFLALTLRGKFLPGAAQALVARYAVTAVNVDREFLAALRVLATERGQGWERVLSSDARFTATGQLGQGLRSYVERAWERVGQRLGELAGGTGTVLFLHNAGLLARYFDAGGHALLTSLQNAARRPADVPHGLWLLCPAESELDSPQLDGQIVEVLGESERVVVSRSLLAGLRDGTGSAA